VLFSAAGIKVMPINSDQPLFNVTKVHYGEGMSISHSDITKVKH
jgi:hypothetical protein